MHVTFYGAVREVTGSMHLLANGSDQILLDCGMFQGRRREASQKNRVMPVDPGMIGNVVLSHAHIDHSGRIPLLTKSDFNGRIYCTRSTADVCEHLLADSAHIQESDADYLNYKQLRNSLGRMRSEFGRQSKRAESRIRKLLKESRTRLKRETIQELLDKFNISGVEPLYTVPEAEQALTRFEGLPYRNTVEIGRNMTCTFYDAGHILGSAISIVKTVHKGVAKTVCYTGDLGRFDKPILNDPTLTFDPGDTDIDLLIMESTYGNREHGPIADLEPALKAVVTETHQRGGVLLIPSFAYGRTQELIYVLHELYSKRQVPRMPVFVDSPLASKLTRVFGEHPEVYDPETHQTFLEKGKNPFSFPQLKFVESVEESMALMRRTQPHIVIASSGMCEAGRILHHLRYKIHDAVHTILIVGFMAQNTLGRRILELGQAYAQSDRKGDPPEVKILNKTYPLKARVCAIDGFSAHGDKAEMFRFLQSSNLRPKKIALVHGEEAQALAFCDFLNGQGYDASVPRLGETIWV